MRRYLRRWSELVNDHELARLPYHIETDRLGRIIMSPPPAVDHNQARSGNLEIFARTLSKRPSRRVTALK